MIGRPRTRIPVWRIPITENPQYLTSISMRVREGQGTRLAPRLAEIRQGERHTMVGTVARYIAQDCREPDLVHIVLVWRKLVMPPDEERESAIKELCADLSDILDWETATFHESQVLLNT